MKHHLIVFFCYELYDIHRRSFENLKQLDADFFIVENHSVNSEKIKKYFNDAAESSRIVKYIKYNSNTSNFGTYLIKNFFDFINEYEYITFTDGDYMFDNPVEMRKEVFQNLEYDDVAISAVDTKLDNLPNVHNAKNWIPAGTIVPQYNYNECVTGIHFLTIKRKNLQLLKNCIFKDHIIHSNVLNHNKKWVKTINHKGLHLTWDLYIEGNPYYEYKKFIVYDRHWSFDPEKEDYTIII